MALYAFDGTWQEGKAGDDATLTNTNVFRFFEAYHKHSGADDLYVAGIGTRFDTIGKVLGGAFGLGELPRLLEAYDHLCRNWTGPTQDRIIDIVGFSRGAATTLDFCNIIQEKGIRRPGSDEVVEKSPRIRFLGVWDVVAAFGFGSLGNEVLNFGHHLQLPKANLQYCFHAMALDERRPSFLNTRLPGACEVWFRGVHSDIGGGNGNKPLNDITFRWMMHKAKAAGLPVDDADVPPAPQGTFEPNHSNKLPLEIRLISAIDRCHYTVAPLAGWATPPATCPKETDADEQVAAELGAAGLEIQPASARQRVVAMWETAMAVAAANDFKLDPIRDALLTLFEARSPLITDEATLHDARDAVRRLMVTTIAGARERGFHVLNEFFLNEALFKLPRLFPLTD
jgi:hypothetical protein